MRETIQPSVPIPYSLHDMNVVAFDVSGDQLILRTQSGMVQTSGRYRLVDGHLEFFDVRWDFCYVYLLGITGNEGKFSGEKLSFRDFLTRFPVFGFSVMDETYGYNMAKYTGYLKAKGMFCECSIEIYHEGDLVFVDETAYAGMSEVILSHDSEAILYAVPAEVAANLDQYCWDFAANWVWHGPENGKFLHKLPNGQYGAMFGAEDFIDYLNRWAFPESESRQIKALGCYGYELPSEYQHYPCYNF